MFVVRALLFFVTLLALSSSASANGWSTTYFSVFAGTPNKTSRADYRPLLRNGEEPDSRKGGRVDAEMKKELESFLHDVAAELEKMGFPDPVAAQRIEPLVRDSAGRTAVRVYLYDFGGAGLGGYSSPCDYAGRRRALHINRRHLVEGGRISDSAYQTLAHELFHAVHAATKFAMVPAPCKQGKWITEGIADAIGFDLARQVRPLNFSQMNEVTLTPPSFIGGFFGDKTTRNNRFLKPWGGRTYSLPLSNPNDGLGDGYFTSSFWRYLAELAYTKGRPARLVGPKDPGKRLDYSYLARLLDHRAKGLGPKNEIAWLDEWMEGSPLIGERLAPAYARFVSSTAHQMAPGMRIPRIRGLGADREKRWQKKILGECREITLSPGAPSVPISLPIKWAASACVRAKITGIAGVVELAVQASGVDHDQILQLRASKLGGELVGTPYAHKPTDGKSGFGLWRFHAKPAAEPVIIFSNMAKKARTTLATRPIITISLPGWTKGGQALQGSPSSDGSKPITTKRQATAAENAKRRKPTRQSASAAVGGLKKGHSKKGKDKVKIALGADIGGIHDPSLVTGDGGVIGKTHGSSQVEGGPTAIASYVTLMDPGKAGMVLIEFPAVGYGKGISVNKARISIHKKRDIHRSITPAPDAKGIRQPNGRVFIKEYSPLLLQGTYSGSLVSYEDEKKLENRRDPLPVVGSVSGSFTVVAPWRAEIEPDTEAMAKQMIDESMADMVQMLRRLPLSVRRRQFSGGRVKKLCEAGITDAQLRSLQIPGSCAGVTRRTFTKRCRCRCGKKKEEEQRPECRDKCERKWESCSRPAEKPLDAETKRYKAAVEDKGIEPMTATQLIISFRDGGSQMRDLLWKQLDILATQSR